MCLRNRGKGSDSSHELFVSASLTWRGIWKFEMYALHTLVCVLERTRGIDMKLLYGTGNPAKLESMRRRLSGLDLDIIGLTDMGEAPLDVPEDGSTPLENARQKALAYFRAYGRPVFSCDSGLYFEGVPEEVQPGVHVRTVGGKHLTDDEMRAYYAGLAEKYGDLRARYKNAICLVLDGEHVFERMDASLESVPFLITAKPYADIRHRGFPLDSLSKDMETGKYFYEMDGERAERGAVQDGFLKFFRDVLAKETLIKSVFT